MIQLVLPRTWLLAALLAGILASSAWAGRPLDTEDTDTVAPGKLQVELSTDYTEERTRRLGALKGVLTVGVVPRLEAEVESSLLLLEPEDEPSRLGASDTFLRAKYRLLDEGSWNPAAALSLTLRVPTGADDRGLGDSEVDVGVLAVLSKAFGPLALTWNGGYTAVTRDRDLDFWTLAMAAEYQVTTTWSLVGELVSVIGAEQAPNTLVARGGATYAVTDRVRLDGAVGVGLTRDSPDLVVTVGVTVLLF